MITPSRISGRKIFLMYGCLNRSMLLYLRGPSLRQFSRALPATKHDAGSKGSSSKSFIEPVQVLPIIDPTTDNVGVELAGELHRNQVIELIHRFGRRPEIVKLCADYGLDERMFHEAFMNFRRFVFESNPLPTDLHITLADIIYGARCVDDLFPSFLQHARKVFPHLECIEDLKKISDLTQPHNWYSEARQTVRKIVFHAGPTNSGKTYEAIDRFLKAETGVYCGPLKLLASEVYYKTNNAGVPCDLITGEERRYAIPNSNASHVSCTIEMLSTRSKYEVAIVDEIQMMRDPTRGWAWTRALLGVCADEVHVCGEEAAIDMVQQLAYNCYEHVEIRRYERKSPLRVEEEAVRSFDNIQDGDCIVTFSKNDLYYASRQVEERNKEVAVIYGSLPPGTKLAQAQKFNDPNHAASVLIATDAIGMGLNLHINRIIFYSLMRPTLQENSAEIKMELLSASQTKQIAGRAGRYGTRFEEGLVTTFRDKDLSNLRHLLAAPVEPLEKAGLFPTADQIELFSFHLPTLSLKKLLDVFVGLSKTDESRYFLCNVEDLKYLSEKIEDIPMPLTRRYVFCLSPINKKNGFVVSMFQKFARRFSTGDPLTLSWLCRQIGWPYSAPTTVADLVHLEAVFDVMDLYLWLGYRFEDMFPDMELVRETQKELDLLIQEGVVNLTSLLRNQESSGQQLEQADPEVQLKPTKQLQPQVFRQQPQSQSLQQQQQRKSFQHPGVVAQTHPQCAQSPSKKKFVRRQNQQNANNMQRKSPIPAVTSTNDPSFAWQNTNNVQQIPPQAAFGGQDTTKPTVVPPPVKATVNQAQAAESITSQNRQKTRVPPRWPAYHKPAAATFHQQGNTEKANVTREVGNETPGVMPYSQANCNTVQQSPTAKSTVPSRAVNTATPGNKTFTPPMAPHIKPSFPRYGSTGNATTGNRASPATVPPPAKPYNAGNMNQKNTSNGNRTAASPTTAISPSNTSEKKPYKSFSERFKETGIDITDK